MHRSPFEIDVVRLDFLERSRPTTGEQRERMELTADRVIQSRQLQEPTFQVADSHSCVTALLSVPIDSVDRIVGGQRLIGFASMIVYGAQVRMLPFAI